MDEHNGWDEYKRLIIETQKRHEEVIEKLRDEMNAGFAELKVAVAGLKVKSSAWGAMSGMVVAATVILIAYAKKFVGV